MPKKSTNTFNGALKSSNKPFMSQRQQPQNTDGFISNNGGRQLGFDRPGIRTGRALPPQANARIRRPSLHGAPSQRMAPSSPLQSQRSIANGYQETSRNGTALPGVRRSQSSTPAGQTTGRRSRRQRPAASKSRRSIPWKKIFKRTSLALGLIVLLTAGWFGWRLFENSKRVFGDSNIFGFLNATKLKGEDQGRTNILLAGVSTDDPGHSGAELTDSIMLISIDTTNKQAFMLSIPRDLWVDIPDYGYSKINAANAYGEGDGYSQPGYPEGGMGLLEQTLSETLEVPIHYYAKLNYSALRDAVNAVGGITVNIQSSDKRGLYDPNISKADQGPLKLPNGEQTIDGQTALNLSRARGDPTNDGRIAYGFEKSDFTRTEHQRMLLLALKNKVASSSTFTNPVKLAELLEVVGKNTKTDLQPGEFRRLYDLGRQIDSNNINSLSLNDANGVNLLASYRTADGASALIPAAGVSDFSDIQLYIKKAMTNDQVVKEAAKVVVLNGGDTSGLATRFSNLLTSKGMNVVAVGDAERQEGQSVIIDLSQNAKPKTKEALQKQFGTSVTNTNTTGYADADFIVVLGTSQKTPASTETEQ